MGTEKKAGEPEKQGSATQESDASSKTGAVVHHLSMGAADSVDAIAFFATSAALAAGALAGGSGTFLQTVGAGFAACMAACAASIAGFGALGIGMRNREHCDAIPESRARQCRRIGAGLMAAFSLCAAGATIGTLDAVATRGGGVSHASGAETAAPALPSPPSAARPVAP